MTTSRRLAAILDADVVGYSRLMGEDEAGTAKIVRERREAASPIVRSFGGRLVKTMGDGVLLEFPSVVAAVECAIAIQKMMAERNAALRDAKHILYRVGVNLGDVLIEGDDIVGDGVNVAARLETICEPGGVCVSGSAYEHVQGRVAVDFADLGEQRLKNIAKPVRAYALSPEAIAAAKVEPADASASPGRREPPRLPEPSAPKKRAAFAPLAAAVVALLIAIAGGAWWFLAANRLAGVAANAPPPLAAQRLSVVVLPFANLSGDPAQDYLADALTDELTTALARIRDSFVIARNTAFTFKGKPVDAKAIGKELGVRYVMEGSVQPSSNQVRVNAQLIDANSGAHLWADQFDTPRADLLQTQDEIIAHLARAIDVQLSEAEAARLKRTPAANPDAEGLALQCQANVLKGGYLGKEADAGYRQCEQALTADPNNTRALAWLSLKFFFTVVWELSADPKADLQRADELSSRAVALDPNYDWAHFVRALALNGQRRLDESIAECERALALNPANAPAVGQMGLDYNLLGQYEKSLEFLDKAVRLSPQDPAVAFWYQIKGGSYFSLKQYDQAIEWSRRAIASNLSSRPWPHFTLISALAMAGHEAEAREALQSYLASVPTGPKTIAAWKALAGQTISDRYPRVAESLNRNYDGLRKAGMPNE
jgi:TolB-like protein/class 3 adenylate cyclase